MEDEKRRGLGWGLSKGGALKFSFINSMMNGNLPIKQ